MLSRIRDIFLRPVLHRTALDVISVVLAVIVGVLAFSAVARGGLGVGPARLAVSIAPASRARTVVDLPPFGTVSAATHIGPVRFDVRVEEIDIADAVRLVEEGRIGVPQGAEVEAIDGLPVTGFSTLLWRIIGGGALAAALAGLLVALAFRRRRSVIALVVAVAVAVPGGAVGIAAGTWDVTAFEEPTLRGNLIHAPQLVDIFSTRLARIERLRDEAAELVVNLAAYYADERSFVSGGALPGTYRVLHVTDQHLDMVGAELARSIARSYDTSLVIDTGDLPILGVEIEGGAFDSLIDTSARRLYVPGNHDSPSSLAALRRLGVTVLASGTVEVDGLRVFGVPDPVSHGFGVEPDPESVSAAADGAFEQFEASLRSQEPTPDIVAVHNPLMELPFVGRVPLILSGHTHSARLYVTQGTVRLNSGTLGGMPYDPAKTRRRQLPYSASVLYFTATRPRRLIAIDRIAVFPQRSTTVTREVIDPSLLP